MRKFTDALRNVADKVDAIDTDAIKAKAIENVNQAKATTQATVHTAIAKAEEATRGDVTQF